MDDMRHVLRLVAEIGAIRGPFGWDWLNDDLVKFLGIVGTMAGGVLGGLKWITESLRADLRDARDELKNERAERLRLQTELSHMQSEMDAIRRAEREAAETNRRHLRRIEVLEGQVEELNRTLLTTIRERAARPRIIPDDGVDDDR